MTTMTTLHTSPVVLVTTTSMMLGPGSNVTRVENMSSSSTGMDTPFTVVMAFDEVRPVTGIVSVDTMLWFSGSVTISTNGCGGR